MRQNVYPSASATASAFYEEAVRHLMDARILLDNGRYPACIASAHKAQELAVKAAFIQENAMGFYDDLFKTHKPLEAVSGNSPLNSINSKLDTPGPDLSARPGLSAEAKKIEKLEPAKNSVNTEYPFHPERATQSTPTNSIVWVSPAAHFTNDEAKKYYNVAREVLLALTQSYAPNLRPGAQPIPDAA